MPACDDEVRLVTGVVEVVGAAEVVTGAELVVSAGVVDVAPAADVVSPAPPEAVSEGGARAILYIDTGGNGSGPRRISILASAGPLRRANACAIGVAAMHSTNVGNLMLEGAQGVFLPRRRQFAEVLVRDGD